MSNGGIFPGIDGPDLPSQTDFMPDAVTAPYDNWNMTITYKGNMGNGQMPIAAAFNSPDDVECVTPQLSAPWGEMIVDWVAVRVGQMPVLPSPETDNPNLKFKEYAIACNAPALEPNGQDRKFVVTGTYIYSMKKAPWITDNLTMGATAYDVKSSPSNTLSPSLFVKGKFF